MDLYPVFTSILLLFLIIGIGYAARKFHLLNARRIHDLSHILVNITLPALTISSLQVPLTAATIGITENMLVVAFAYYLGAFCLSIAICRFLPATGSEKGIYQFILVFPNVGFMGIPISIAILGQKALFHVILFNAPFYLLAFTLGIYLMTRDSRTKFDPKVLITPGLAASVIGLVLFLFGYLIPAPISTAIEWLGMLTTPLAMIVVGAQLSVLPLSNLAGDWRIALITGFRLLILPVLAFLILAPLVHDELLVEVAVLLIAMPAASNTILFSEEYHTNPTLASQGVFLSTVFSLVTIPVIALLLFVK